MMMKKKKIGGSKRDFVTPGKKGHRHNFISFYTISSLSLAKKWVPSPTLSPRIS
jgi:hypothetical protein